MIWIMIAFVAAVVAYVVFGKKQNESYLSSFLGLVELMVEFGVFKISGVLLLAAAIFGIANATEIAGGISFIWFVTTVIGIIGIILVRTGVVDKVRRRNSVSQPNGTGSIMVNRNAQDGTVKIHGHYCNYECLDCTNRIASYLSYPGFFIMGSDSEDRDNINFELDEVSCTDSEFGVQSISQALYSSLPNAIITGQTNRADFCSVQFKT